MVNALWAKKAENWSIMAMKLKNSSTLAKSKMGITQLWFTFEYFHRNL